MTVTMRGPADADRFRVQSGYARRYRDDLPADELRPTPHGPDESVVAMSTVKNAEGKSALVGWAAGKVAEAAVDQADAWQAMSRDDAVAWLSEAGDRARDKAAGRGTNVHSIVERLLDGRGLDAFNTDAGSEYLPAITAFVDEWRPELEFAEVVAFGNVDGDEWAGTFDAILRLGPLGLCMVDYKSRNAEARDPHRPYAGEVCQLGGYSDADYIIVEDPDTGEAVRRPMPHLDGLALITFTPDDYDVHPIDLDKARDAWHRLYGWWKGAAVTREAVTPRRARPYPPHKVKPLGEMTKAELLDVAEARGIAVAKSSTKAVIVEALSAEPVVDSDPTPAAGIERPLVTVDGLTGPAAETEADVEADHPFAASHDGPHDCRVPGCTAEPNAHPADVEAETVELVREELRRRATTLLTLDDGEAAIRRRWPADVPSITDADTYDQLVAIGKALDRAEADVGAPFDPPPTEAPTSSSPAEEAPAPAPTVDEGALELSDDDVGTVRTGYNLAEPAGRAWLADIAGRAGNLSLDQRRTERRLLLGWSLVRIAVAGHYDDELLDAVLRKADAYLGDTDDPAAILAQTSAGVARRISAIVGDLVEDRLTFSVDPTGRMALVDA